MRNETSADGTTDCRRAGPIRAVASSALLACALAMAFASAALACPNVQFFGVRGSGEHSGFGPTVGAVLSHVNYELGRVGVDVGNEPIKYWAVDVKKPWEPKYRRNYVASVRQGVDVLGRDIAAFHRGCADTPIIIAGYSQGAEVVDDWLANADLTQVAGVALFGDPRFDSRNSEDQPGFGPHLNGVAPMQFLMGHAPDPFGTLVRYRSPLRSILRSYCARHDEICGYSSVPALIHCLDTSCDHYHYMNRQLGGIPYTTAGANFLIGRYYAALSSTGSARGDSGSGAAPPGDVSAPPGAQSPGGADSTSPTGPSPSGVAETVGGVTHTWTDYADAGGSEGPSIQTAQTVLIACRTTGFRVADGNTWWYLIASSPWNGSYYASADAFYNDGGTSGNLLGTPWVDTAVPECAGTVGQPTGPSSPPALTYGETVGGVTHTWTNYSNAGGNEGPAIQAGQTVQIACKLTGFRVADGNTWWYRIASSPWNGSYYASADAFYNNGQTSGSLIGTPFVDNGVPNC